MEPRKQSSLSSQLNLETLTENEIEGIWKRMGSNSKPRGGKKLASLDTTPTTDYSGNIFKIHPETLEEELEEDKKLSKMKSVLQAKRLNPKSYLPQVILYDNVSHDRMLEMRLKDIKLAHKVAEKRSKRREETFVKSLERKQDEWTKRDARVMEKLEPSNLSELNFTFGRLYNKGDYPYQAIIRSFKQPMPTRHTDHSRNRPILLPQVSNRQLFEDEDTTFITKLPKLQRIEEYHMTRTDQSDGSSGRNRRGRRRKEKRKKDWLQDSRFQTLTDLLGENYSPQFKKEKEILGPITSRII